MQIKPNKAFTIVELLVAMALMMILTAMASLIFAAAVRGYRTADSAMEITRRADAIRSQLDADFAGLRKDGEIFLAWLARPARDIDGNLVTPFRYEKFDRIIFFANGNFQTYNPQRTTVPGVTKHISGDNSIARISYVPAKDKSTPPKKTHMQFDRKSRILARTQHIITADNDMPVFPAPLPWDAVALADFRINNFKYEYQTMTRPEWVNLWQTNPSNKMDILTILSDIQFGGAMDGGPEVDKKDSGTYHNYFAEGVGEFGIQVWRQDQQRWFPEIDPDGNGDYSDTDYPANGLSLNDALISVDYILYNGITEKSFASNDPAAADWRDGLMTYSNTQLKFTALKFTFTLYDSKGLYPDGRTFTHIVMINN